MAIQTINPFDNSVVKKYTEYTDEAVDQKIATAHEAYKIWKDTPVADRAKLLAKISELLLQNKKKYAQLITLEMGKLIGESEDEIDISAAIFKYYADNAEKFLEDKPFEVEEGKAYVRYTSIGVILGVEPWNYPFYQVARVASPNVAVGNVIMVKHASNVPQCAQAIEDLFIEAGAAEGIYTNLFISSKKIDKLAQDNRIKGLALTGSEEAGASLAESAGKNLKKSVLELGGSDPFIVLDDADIDNAVEQAFNGRMKNMGQSCTAAKRLIVADAIADEFLEKFSKRMSGLKVGNPADETTEIGPLSSEDAVKKLAEQVKDSIAAGATAVLGGKRLERDGAFMEPTILTNLKPGMRAYHEELFGPVASFYRVKDEDEAIKLANDSEFGLGGAVFSKDIKRAERVALQIETGMVFINQPTASSP